MKTTRILLLAAAALFLASCGTSIKRPIIDPSIETRSAIFSAEEMVVFLDDYKRTRKNADRVFYSWIEAQNLRRSITAKRLLSIAPRQDGCHLSYDFRLMDGTQHRVTLVVPEYRQEYRRKKARRDAMTINRKTYYL